MKFETVLGQLIASERISKGLASSLTFSLDNYLGSLVLRTLGLIDKKIKLRDLPMKDFIKILKYNVLSLYIPGLGPKRLRELKLAMIRFIDDYDLGYTMDFPRDVTDKPKQKWGGFSSSWLR